MSQVEVRELYEGHIVPQQFSAGFVALSYLVSLVGAGSTLELINRRTGSKGLFNNVLLGGSAVTMGGVSIWSMHFVGNRAIQLADGAAQLQIAFSTGLTVLSFFVPIIVLLVAFVAIGSYNAVSWWRVSLGGLLCGAAVCGMHYLGNSSIDNYTCVYKVPYVIGSAVIAVAASTIALSMFFVFRAMWANAWWKRTLSALLLAGAVSGMHWCAALGTEFRLKSARGGGSEASSNATVIVVICLSVVACGIIAGLAIFTARKRTQTARRAQKITLGAAIFDKHGRILVDPDGLIPSTVVTGSFMQTGKQGFSNDHPYFLWMFQATRNWSGMLKLVEGMGQHVAQVGTLRGYQNTRPTSESPDMDETQGIIFREQFCMAAGRLAERMRENLSSAGVLWDQILPTGATLPNSNQATPPRSSVEAGQGQHVLDLVEKGLHERYGTGSLMFLVRRVRNEREVEKLSIAGYRFAELEQVSGTIASSMQIQTPGMGQKLQEMAMYADQDIDTSSGVHLGFFGVRARVNGSGFNVLVQRTARHRLPTVPLPMDRLEPWHINLLRRFDDLTLLAMVHAINGMTAATPEEKIFATYLSHGIQSLRDLLQDPIVENAVFIADVVKLPCQSEEPSAAKTMLTFGLVLPIHNVVNNPDLDYVSLSLFKAHQLVQLEQNQLAFVRNVHREFGPIIQKDVLRGIQQRTTHSGGVLSKLRGRRDGRWWKMPISSGDVEERDVKPIRRVSSAALSGSSSTVDLCNMKVGDQLQPVEMVRELEGVYKEHATQPSFGGIMVSEVITVNVETRGAGSTTEEAVQVVSTSTPNPRSPGLEMQRTRASRPKDSFVTSTRIVVAHEGDGETTFVDDLFQKCVESRWWQK